MFFFNVLPDRRARDKGQRIFFCPQKDPWAACSAAMRNVLCLLHIFTYCWASPLVIDSVKFLLPDDFNILLTDIMRVVLAGQGRMRAHTDLIFHV